MRRLIVAALAAAAAGVFAPAASADQIDSNPLSITASGTGELQITDGGTPVFFPSFVTDQGHAGLEIKANGDYYSLNDPRRHPVSGPTLTNGATVDDPDLLTSVYRLVDVNGVDYLQVTEVISYVAGSPYVDLHYDVQNLADTPVPIRATEAADLAYGNDRGRSLIVDHHGARLVGGWTPEGKLAGIEEVTPWNAYEAGDYSDVFADSAGVGFPSRVDPTLQDNGVGVDWTDTLAVGATKSIDLRWRIGADVKVDTTADPLDPDCATACSIRGALAAAQPGDVVTVPTGNYQLVAGLELARDVTLLGGGAQATTIRGAPSSFVIGVSDVSVSLSAFTITGGDSGDGNGGGIWGHPGSIVRVTDSAITGNRAWDGGGIAVEGTLDLERSTVSNNRADDHGGGVYAQGGQIVNSTLSGNAATDLGGGLWVQGGPVVLTNDTIAGNAAGAGGGMYFVADTQVETGRNTIIAGNTGGGCGGLVGQMEFDFSLSDDSNCLLGSGQDNQLAGNPKLGLLYDNGGDTLTRALQPGSPALDNGDDEVCPRIDQRGAPRPDGDHCDIGAVEGLEDPAFLGVITHVVNDNGSHATAASFVTHVRRGTTDVVPAQAGSESGSFFDSIPSGTYRLVTTGPAGYSFTYGEDCAANGAFAAVPDGDTICTVVANDTVAPTATLKVVTQVVNDDGGDKAPGDFSVHVRSGAADVTGSPKPGNASGTTYTVTPGAYTVGPVASGVYDTAIGGSCAASGAVTLAAGAVKTCTVTENDKSVPKKKFNATTASGDVTIKVPGSNTFVTLGPGVQIPVGTVVDTRKGRVTLIAAADGKGGTASADFYDGLFKVGQTKGKKPITELTLVEKLSCKGSGKAASAAKKKKKKRRLWGDGHGKFRTKGSFSSATVRGTHWLVQDTCTTTTTTVKRGIVAVNDFVKHKTVKVKAGHKYVARKRHK